MLADAHFVIGSGHAVCQDYALAHALDDGRALAVVSDGCSSSARSDVGARLLAHTALRSLRAGTLEVADVLRRADGLRRALQLPVEALDATLLTLVADRDGAVVLAWGDGVVVGRRRGGSLDVHRIDYAGHAPPYPSYALDRDRLAAYVAAGLGRRTVVPPGNAGRVAEEPGGPVRLAFPRDVYDLVAIASDGVTAVRDRDRAAVPVADVLDALLRFPARSGAFVQRRCRRFAGSECAARGWIAHDDIALAVVISEAPT
jgi:hypothetical protein